ncbi:hypothetical protein P7K49_014268 [Saguinus oedipus]|uniref:Uncharacterized protein n=1 Tax=Saguinus oedipus TaxID=9490 RepID=A0ABQ9VKJ8_SAGOE|nr:hypothetical protein P7K49_014268 [Saguinus oedipus]
MLNEALKQQEQFARQLRVGSTDWEGGGARPPDLWTAAVLRSRQSFTVAGLAGEAGAGRRGQEVTLRLRRPRFPTILGKPE